MIEFKEFPKIKRLYREIIITEKIDGTNAGIFIGEDGEFLTSSRTRWITPDGDNYGFSAWAHDNKDALLTLGPGMHFGEWWGAGIQRGYGLTKKRFSLFNVSRYAAENLPSCVGVVPVLYTGVFDGQAIKEACADLSLSGSRAAPGFMRPEGIVIFHTANNTLFKYTFDGDGHKGK